jgi:hypothetical protein
MSQFPNPAGFRPELGLPWFNYTMQGLSSEQIAQKTKGCRPFVFRSYQMAPAFPIGTQVVLRPVDCKCKLTVGKVYVLFTKGGEFVAHGRLTNLEDSEELDRWGVRLTLKWEDGRECMPPWIWPHPGHILYALAYYGSVDIASL